MRDEGFHNLYFSPKCPIDKMRASGTENTFTTEEERALRITTHRTEDNIKIDHEGTV